MVTDLNTANTAENVAKTANGAENTAENVAKTANGAENTAENVTETANGAENTAENVAKTANGAEKPAEIIRIRRLNKSYFVGENEVKALNNVEFSVVQGDFVAILGPSGSGKTTLMNIIGCLDTPTSGEYFLYNKNIARCGQSRLARIRNKEIGFVFQQFNLMPRLNIAENVEVPLVYAGVSAKTRRKMAAQMLEKVGLGDKLDCRPSQLSGGQQQRVAIARALVTKPSVLLADEPTGALDQTTGKQILQLFSELNDEGRTIIIITHDPGIALCAKRTVKIVDGILSGGENA